jgi:hypothetical protein
LSYDGIVYAQAFRPGGINERIQFDPRQIISGKNSFSQIGVVGYQIGCICTYPVDEQIRFEKFKMSSGICFHIHQIDVPPSLGEFYL